MSIFAQSDGKNQMSCVLKKCLSTKSSNMIGRWFHPMNIWIMAVCDLNLIGAKYQSKHTPIVTACQVISHNLKLMKFGCCNVQTSKFHMNLYMTSSVARQQVLPDVTYFVAFWEYLWLLTKTTTQKGKIFQNKNCISTIDGNAPKI